MDFDQCLKTVEANGTRIQSPWGTLLTGEALLDGMCRHPSGAGVRPHLTMWIHEETRYVLLGVLAVDDGKTRRLSCTARDAGPYERPIISWLVAHQHLPKWVLKQYQHTGPSQVQANG